MPRPGHKKPKGYKLKFVSEPSISFYHKILESWPELIKNKKTIIFLPCASTKPIQTSLTHCYLSEITRIYEPETLIVIVSEPLVLIPYLECEYPNYDYPPEKLRKNPIEMEIFINRLRLFRYITPKNIKCYYIGASHHYDILKKSGWNPEWVIPKKGLIGYKDAAKELCCKLGLKRKAKKMIKFKIESITRKNVKMRYRIT